MESSQKCHKVAVALSVADEIPGTNGGMLISGVRNNGQKMETAMMNFDVIVIGAGPAGGYTALSVARRGCRAAIFEEHKAIGLPRHDPRMVNGI